VVETGESRTPRPEESIPGYPTGLASNFFSPSKLLPAKLAEPADLSLAVLIGVRTTAPRLLGAQALPPGEESRT